MGEGPKPQSPRARKRPRGRRSGFRGLDSEVGFWHALLDPANRENPEVDAAAWETAKDWLRDGGSERVACVAWA